MSFSYGTQAHIVKDSISPEGKRLTTMKVTFHRFVLAELNTHRKFSRNSASSRAIPFETMLRRAMEHPAIPFEWPREQPGMSGGAELEGEDKWDAEDTLFAIRDYTTRILTEYIERHPDKSTRLHKSLLNRPLEWFMWHTAIISSTEWENFFAQRISKSAQPEIHALALVMKTALDDSRPDEIPFGGWHLPFVDMETPEAENLEEAIKISTARCARVSYLTHDDIRDASEDIRMYDETLWANGHWSPMEHPALCLPTTRFKAVYANFSHGWAQHRYFAENDMNSVAKEITEWYLAKDGTDNILGLRPQD